MNLSFTQSVGFRVDVYVHLLATFLLSVWVRKVWSEKTFFSQPSEYICIVCFLYFISCFILLVLKI